MKEGVQLRSEKISLLAVDMDGWTRVQFSRPMPLKAYAFENMNWTVQT